MANVYLSVEHRCGGCDCFDTGDGCECREVACKKCGKRNHIYNMNHPDKENREVWDDISFEDKLNGFYCEECGETSDEEQEEEEDEFYYDSD